MSKFSHEIPVDPGRPDYGDMSREALEQHAALPLSNPCEYRTSAGRRFAFEGWPPGERPTELFDSKRWLECLHACMFAASRRVLLEDDAILHELVHLALGIDICTHNTMAELREAVVALESTP